MIELIKYLILGLIQGFTEPIPVSSSGHLNIFEAILNSNTLSDLNFEIFVNFIFKVKGFGCTSNRSC